MNRLPQYPPAPLADCGEGVPPDAEDPYLVVAELEVQIMEWVSLYRRAHPSAPFDEEST